MPKRANVSLRERCEYEEQHTLQLTAAGKTLITESSAKAKHRIVTLEEAAGNGFVVGGGGGELGVFDSNGADGGGGGC